MARGAAANLVALGLSQVLGAVAGIVVARQLGPEGVGALAVMFGLFAVLHPLVAFMATASVIDHARTPDLQRVFGTSLVLKGLVSLGLLVLAVVFAVPVGRFLGVPSTLVIVAGSGYLAATGYEVALNRLEAEGRMLARSVILPLGPLVYLLLAFAIARDPVSAALATVAGSLAMSLAAAPHLRGLRLEFDRPTAAFMWRLGSRMVAGDLLLLGLLWFDTFCVNLFLGKAEAGIYQTAYNIGLLLVLAATVLEVSLVPVLSKAHASGGDLRVGYHAGSLLALGLALATVLVAVPLGPFVLALYGPAFVHAYPALLVLLVMGTAGALFFPVKAVLASVERPDLTLHLIAVQLAINVPLNLVLIPAMGIVGAGVAAAVAFAVGTLAGWWVVHRTVGVWPFPPLREWRRTLGDMF